MTKPNYLYTVGGKIVGIPTILCQKEGIIALSVHQQHPLVEWFRNYLVTLKYENAFYSQVHCVFDVAGVDRPKMQKLFNRSAKGATPSLRGICNCLVQSPFREDYEARLIVFVLKNRPQIGAKALLSLLK